jgi:hypothetical protein
MTLFYKEWLSPFIAHDAAIQKFYYPFAVRRNVILMGYKDDGNIRFIVQLEKKLHDLGAGF